MPPDDRGPLSDSPAILLSPPDVGELEQEYVLRAMRSGWIAPAGPDLTAFEREVAERVGVAHAVGLSSGTAALHLALVRGEARPAVRATRPPRGGPPDSEPTMPTCVNR